MNIENSGLKPLLIFISILCCIILAGIFMVEVDSEQMEQLKEAADADIGFSFGKMFAYIKYYLSKLIGFLFQID